MTQPYERDGALYVRVRGVEYVAAHAVWEMANDEDLGDREVVHVCGDFRCLNPLHLAVVPDSPEGLA